MDIAPNTNPAIATSATPSSSQGTLREKAVELEGLFINTLVSQMFSSLDARNEFGGGYAEETWRGMQSEMLASQIANSGGVGLADQIMSDLIAMQEASSPQNNYSASRPSYPTPGSSSAQNAALNATSIGAF